MTTKFFTNIVIVTPYDDRSKDKQYQDFYKGIVDGAAVYNIPVKDYHRTRVVHIRPTTARPLFISLGGDGTMLTAMRAAAYEDGTVLGINFGHLGFLTNNTINNENEDGNMYELAKSMLLDIFNTPERWAVEKRWTLIGTRPSLLQNGTTYLQDEIVAINEILIAAPSRQSGLVNYTIEVNGNHAASQSGDGVMVATPTGSTAYSLSAGGAIITPETPVMQITPLAPHTLTSKPLIVSMEDTVKIKFDITQRTPAVDVVVDGLHLIYSYQYPQRNEGEVTITTNGTIKVLRENGWNFFDVLNQKMGWK